MKDRKLSIRISDNDWQRFHDKAEQADMSLTEYVTACCLGKQIVVIDGLDEVIHQQKAIGRNLNQITTLANMGKIKTGTLICHKSERNKINKTFRFTDAEEQFRHENYLPSIITKELWEQVQELMDMRKKKGW